MKAPSARSVRIIGLGNRLRGDDAVGLLVAQRLREKMAGQPIDDRIEVLEAELVDVDWLDWFPSTDNLLLIDAIQSGAEPGTVHRWDLSAGPIPARGFSHSTHALSVADLLELARTLHVLPPRVLLFGIDIQDTSLGHPLSSNVARAVDRVVELVATESEAIACMNSI